MKKIIICGLLFISWQGYAQPPLAVINGAIGGLKDGSKVWLIPNKADIAKDSAIVKDGKFSFQYRLIWAGSYSLRLSRQFEPGKWRDFYIDKGVLNLKATDTVFTNLKTWGSQHALEYSNYTSLLEANHIFRTSIKATKKEMEASTNNDTILAKQSFIEYMRADSLKKSLSRQWISRHPASVISSFILYTIFFNSLSMESLDTLLTKLQSKARSNLMFSEMEEVVATHKATAIGKTAPLFTQNDMNGKPFSLESLGGHYVLIDFWASWCVPCRAENPSIIIAYNKFKEKGFMVVGVSLDDNREKWLEAIRHDALPWIQVSDLRLWENDVARKYHITSVPANFLIAPDGTIVAKNIKGEDLANYLSNLFK